VSWAFLFEDQPYFDGFRDLATNGIDKPVLNVFRMLGKMGGTRLAVESSGGLALEAVRDRGVGAQADVTALASRDASGVSVLAWNYHDDNLPARPSEVALTVSGLPRGRPLVTHYRVDRDHGNAYEAWQRMGSPQQPTEAQYRELETAGPLALLEQPRRVVADRGSLTLAFPLPRQGVSLVRIEW
jgi:xylan 1,4-beta-xylosidase